jgi:hypothetical protein
MSQKRLTQKQVVEIGSFLATVCKPDPEQPGFFKYDPEWSDLAISERYGVAVHVVTALRARTLGNIRTYTNRPAKSGVLPGIGLFDEQNARIAALTAHVERQQADMEAFMAHIGALQRRLEKQSGQIGRMRQDVIELFGMVRTDVAPFPTLPAPSANHRPANPFPVSAPHFPVPLPHCPPPQRVAEFPKPPERDAPLSPFTADDVRNAQPKPDMGSPADWGPCDNGHGPGGD